MLRKQSKIHEPLEGRDPSSAVHPPCPFLELTVHYNVFFPPVYLSSSPATGKATHYCPGPLSQRHTVPLVPVTGHRDITQPEGHSLGDVVGLIHVGIHGEAKFSQSLDLATGGVIKETLISVLRYSGSYSQLSSLVHHGPAHWGPLRPQQTEAGEGPDTALNESLTSLIATKIPEFIHQGSMGNIQG